MYYNYSCNNRYDDNFNYSKKKNEKRKVLYQYERRNEIMRTLEDIITIENNYFSQCGGSLNIKEADKNQNTI